MKTRMHPTVIAENLISSLALIVFLGYGFLIQILESTKGEILQKASKYTDLFNGNTFLLGVLVFLALIIIATAFFYIMWRNTYIYFKDNNLIIEKGKLFKTNTTIHLSDIASINFKKNIVQKIFGTTNLKVELNTSAGETFNRKLVFKDDMAIKIKNGVFERIEKEIKENEDITESLVKYETKNVFIHMLLSINITSILVILISYSFFYFGALKDLMIGNIFIIVIIIFLLVVPFIWSLLKDFLSYFNFKITKENDNIKLSYGALTTYKYSIPISRINAVIIHQSIQARLLGYYMIDVVNAGLGGINEEKTIISLYVKENEKNIILNEILHEYNNKIILQNQNKNALKHFLWAKTFWIVAIIVLSIIFTPFLLLFIPLLIVIPYAQYKTKKLGYDGNIIKIQNGVFSKKTTMMKYNNIEIIKNKKLLLSNIFKTYGFEASVVGPVINRTFTSGLFNKNLLEEITSEYMKMS